MSETVEPYVVGKSVSNRRKSGVLIRDASTPHDYRTEIPNIILERGLSSKEIHLYLFYKKVAGDTGSCYYSMKNIGKAIGCSPTTVLKARKGLEKAGVIVIDKTTDERNQQTVYVTIADIWPENHECGINKAKVNKDLRPPIQKLVTKKIQ